MREATRVQTDRKRESGAALLVAVLLLAMLGVIGLASMETVTRDRQVAGFQNRARVALYAADAGVAHAVGIIRAQAQTLAPGGEAALEGFNPAFPGKGGATNQVLGSDFPAPGSPSYGMDPNASDPTNVARSGAGDPIHRQGQPVPRLDHEQRCGQRAVARSHLGRARDRLGPGRRQRRDPGRGRELPSVQLPDPRRPGRIRRATRDARRRRCERPPRPIASSAFATCAPERCCSASRSWPAPRTTPRSSPPRSRRTCC